MSTALHTTSPLSLPQNPANFKASIIVADWNGHITEALLQGAMETFSRAGVSSTAITVTRVPGSVELVYGAARAIRHEDPSAVIVLGCVIKGDTPHFDYVCQSVTQGVTMLNARGEVPVIFGLLTTLTERQALDRAGGSLGNKGSEAAATAIAMANLKG